MSLLTGLLEQREFSKSRLPSLYSDFARLKTTNRDGYDANCQAWAVALGRVLLSAGAPAPAAPAPATSDAAKVDRQASDAPDAAVADRCCITASKDMGDLLKHSQWGRPLALGCVEAEAVANGLWVPAEDYIEVMPRDADSASASAASTPLRTGLSRLMGRLWYSPSTSSGAAGGSHFTGGCYVIKDNVRACADTAYGAFQERLHARYSEHVFARHDFEHELRAVTKVALSARDCDAVLTLLRKRKLVALSKDAEVVKLRLTTEEPCVVTETDTAVAQLKRCLTGVEAQCDALEAKIRRHDAEAREAAAKGRKSLALSAIRARKAAEAQAETWRDRREQVDTVLLKIDDAAQQVGVVRALEGGSRALATVLAQIGGVEKVDSLVDRLREDMDRVDDINEAIAGASAGVRNEIDDDELEAEFARLKAAAEGQSIKHGSAVPDKGEPLVLPDAPTGPLRHNLESSAGTSEMATRRAETAS